MAKIYRKRGNKLNEVVTFDSACTRQENQPLVYDATDGSVHTTTHIGCLNADDVSVGNLTVTGQAIIQEQVTDTIDSNTLVLRSNADAGLTGTENSGVIIHNYNGSEDLYAVTDNTGTFRVGTAVSTTTTYAYLRYNETDNKWYSTAPEVTPTVEVTPIGSPTSWDSVVTSGDDVEYTNIVFSVIDRTSLEPLTTRDESTDMEADYLTKWNDTDEKIITIGTSCTHDLCANGDITSTGNITADGNVCVKTNITVDGNSCVKGNSTVSGEIHSCKCITAPTACISDDLYVAGDINNCNTDSIMHGYYGCFENNVCIKGDLAIDGVATLPGLVSDCVASVENTTNSSFYLPFVEENHLVKGANDLYTNGSLKYNPGTDVLCTKTFCSDRGIVQSAFYGVTAANLGLTANTAYSLSTIVSCLQACCGNKAVSYLFSYANATNPKVTEYGNEYAYNLTFEKLDNNGLSGTYTKSRWLVTGANGVSWTVTGTTGSTAGSITWSVCKHIVDQVCVNVARDNINYPLILSDYQSTPSCSKKTLYNDLANYLTYNPSKETLNARCINASASLSQGNLSYKYKFQKNHNSGRTTLLVLEDISCAVCCSDCAIGIIGKVCDSRAYYECETSSIVEDINFYIKVNDEATGSSAMDIKYYGYGENQLRPVIITRNDNEVYAAMCISGSQCFLSFDTIGASSVINEVCVDANGVYKDSIGCTYAITKAGDLATLCVNASSSNVWTADQNTNYPIVFSTYQTTPAAGCKILYNDSANNLMYNPGTNTLTTCTICANTFCGSVDGETRSIIADGYVKLRRADPYIDFQLNNYTGSYTTSIYQTTQGRMSIAVNNGIGTSAATETSYFGFFSTGSFCAPRNIITPELVSPVPSTANRVSNLSFSSGCCNASSFTAYNMCLCGYNGVLYNPQGYNVPYGRATTSADANNPNDNTVAAGTLVLDSLTCTKNCKSFIGSINKGGSAWYNTISIRHRNGYGDGCTYGSVLYQPMTDNAHWCFGQNINNVWYTENQLIDSTGGQTINWNLSATGTVYAATFCGDLHGNVTATYLQVNDMTITSSTSTPISLTCGSYKVRIDNYDNIVIGCTTSTSGSGNIAIGKTASASQYGVALGNKAYANARSFAAGSSACAYAEDTIAIGAGAKANSSNSIAIGCGSMASGDGAVSIGSNATAHIGFLALGTCATSDVAIDTTTAGNPMFPYSSIIEIDDIKYGRHGRIKFVIPSCSKNIDITSFFNSLFISEINNGRCKNTWSTSSFENIPTLVAHLSGFYWDDGGSSDGYQRWAPGINGRGNINELILLNTSAGASSNLSVYDLIVTCGKNICTTSWNWGTGTNVWTCGMVGVIEF